MADAFFRRTDVDAHASTSTLPAYKSTPAAGTCNARATTSTTSCHRVLMDLLPAPLTFSVQHRDEDVLEASKDGGMIVGMEKALSAVFVS